MCLIILPDGPAPVFFMEQLLLVPILMPRKDIKFRRISVKNFVYLNDLLMNSPLRSCDSPIPRESNSPIPRESNSPGMNRAGSQPKWVYKNLDDAKYIREPGPPVYSSLSNRDPPVSSFGQWEIN
jgi:hypothetical protein